MAQIEQMEGSVEESIAFMQRELEEDGEHHLLEVIGMIMVQLSMKAAEKEFGVESRLRTSAHFSASVVRRILHCTTL
jgi:hypothetical protein